MPTLRCRPRGSKSLLCGSGTRRTIGAFLGIGLISGWAALPVPAAVANIAAADVTPRAFSMVWATSASVSGATVRVYANAGGTVELTGSLGIRLASQSTPGAHVLGLVKVDVTGAAPNTCYYVQSQTTTAAGTESSPAAPPFLSVCTAVALDKINAANQPIANDVILHDLLTPAGSAPATGAFVLASAPDLGPHAVWGTVGTGGAPETAAADLNNLFDDAGTSVEIPSDTVIQIREYRGLLCAGLSQQARTRYGRAPEHEEEPAIGAPITEAERLVPCFFADTHCDGTIDILDTQRALNVFGAQSGDCRFNPDLDVVADQVIDVLDVQSVLNRFGQSAPFP